MTDWDDILEKEINKLDEFFQKYRDIGHQPPAATPRRNCVRRCDA